MDLPKRKQNRLRNYDYSQSGTYFITICTKDRQKLFGSIVGDGSPVPLKLPEVELSAVGKIVSQSIEAVPEKYVFAKVEKYVVMPNHVHLLLNIQRDLSVCGTEDPSPTVGSIIAWLKYRCVKQANEICGTPGKTIWQRSFHDHIIRNEHDYEKIWQYIDTNPLKWEQDCFYCE